MTARLPERKSSRLKGYDYSKSGFYFITICTQDRINRFGKIEDGNMIFNDAGKMVQSVWFGLPQRFPTIKLDAFQIIPNHIHGIIKITTTTAVPAANRDADPVGTPLVGVRNAPTSTTVLRNTTGMNDMANGGGMRRTGTRPVPTGTDTLEMGDENAEKTLGNIVGAFKSIITHRYCNGVKMGLGSSFNKQLFQHRFHDHIIRNENELFRIRQYIESNPANWHNDKMNAQDHNSVNEILAQYEEESWQV